MNRIFSYILISALLIAASASFATDVPHNFGTKIADNTLTLSNANKVGRTDDGLVYTCRGNVDFRYVLDPGYMCIHLPNGTGDSVIISPPLTKLSELKIYPYSHTAKVVDVKVAISTDGATWREDLVTMDYSNSTFVRATIPVRAYYLKIYAVRSTDILSITYTYLDCNCFSVTP